MAARPYKLFGARERALLAAALEERVSAWSAAWLPVGTAPRLESAPACESQAWRRAPEAAAWTALAAPGGELVACAASDADLAELARALCGAPARLAGSSGIARDAAARALEDLCAGLLAAPAAKTLRGAAASPEAHAGAQGSACYAAELAFGAARIAVLSNAEWTLRALRERSAPVANAAPAARPLDRRSGVGGQRVALRVIAGSIELDVAALRALAPGDVLALDTRIDRPLGVATAAGAPVCGARLGSKGGRKAASLTPAPLRT